MCFKLTMKAVALRGVDSQLKQLWRNLPPSTKVEISCDTRSMLRFIRWILNLGSICMNFSSAGLTVRTAALT